MPGIFKESKQYVHEQAIASPIWTIQHNMGALAAIDVYVEENGVMQKIIPAATNYINPMVMEVVFSTARAGHAIASA